MSRSLLIFAYQDALARKWFEGYINENKFYFAKIGLDIFLPSAIRQKESGKNKIIREATLEEIAAFIATKRKRQDLAPMVIQQVLLLPKEKGPNTASIGSYSEQGYLLPFMEKDDYSKASLIKNIV